MSTKKRIPVDGQPFQWKSPFAELNRGVPANRNTPPAVSPPALSSSGHRKTRGRVDIIRSTAHRGGKTMTVVSGFVGISQEEKERLAKAMQKACGAGGTVKEGRIEIQGDQRETVARILTGAGFRPVFAGG
ncbi:MAG: translation initiation factor [Nitrospiraceae bacterium]|nr:translation initiation factor [Nitrospiraceae bacterium]